jgi:peptide/histidine transporter 3/4
MWSGAILLCLVYILKSHINILIAIPSFMLASGIGGFFVVIIQFSIDQLLDSSSVQIVSFITWFIWTYFASQAASKILVCLKHLQSEIYPLLFVSVVLTVSMASDFLFSHWLVKEPVVHNPLKLIFQTLRYAAKSKYPSNKSAFSYWDKKHCSRLDLAKIIYGGPFTAKEVEDVKSFFRNLGLISMGCLLFAVSIYHGSNLHVNVSMFSGFHSIVCRIMSMKASECVRTVALANLGYPLLVVCIPLYEFFILPVFWKCLPQLRIFKRMLLGCVLTFLYLLGLLSLEVVGVLESHSVNATCDVYSSCVPDVPQQDSSLYWLALLSVAHAVGQCYFASSGIEFVCSQTAYSMKGLMFGSVFMVLGVSLTLVHLLFLPFQHTLISIDGTVMGCMFWFLMSCSVLAAVVIVIFCVVTRRYMRRQ